MISKDRFAPSPEAPPAYILAGGASRRFGSDKARAPVAGQPLLLHMAALLRPWVSELHVIGREADQYADLGLPTLGDLRPGLGPLGGLHTALEHSAAQNSGNGWVLLASCDTWGVTDAQLQHLLSASRHKVHAVAWRDSHWQPLWALYHVSLAPEVAARLARGERALWRLLDAVAVTPLNGLDLGWRQINTPATLPEGL
ncbi:MAG: molybdenum cofactor guanylyltransferase [Candidatus Sericytochromatia bacterium]